jgi:hypothetical protein
MAKKKAKPVQVLRSKQMTITQPVAWIEAWKNYMTISVRTNLSAFIAEAVNGLISAECKKYGRSNPVEGCRGERGKKTET